MNDLDIEDFRRLGVRLHESRSLVIRRAAARSSQSLAESQLSTPSAQNELQLSRIVTSTYRLLDPRKRPDFLQRAQIGRVLQSTASPRDPSQLGITAFKALSNQDDADEHDDLSDAIDLEDESVFSTTHYNRESFISLVRSLDAQDLIRRRPYPLPVNSVRRTFEHPWVIVSLLGLVVLMMIGLVKLNSIPESLTLQRLDTVQPLDPTQQSSAIVPAITTQEPADTLQSLSPSTELNTAELNTAELQPSEPLTSEPQDSNAPELREVVDVPMPPLSEDLTVEPIETTEASEQKRLIEETTIGNDSVETMNDAESGSPSEFAPDPFAALARSNGDLSTSEVPAMAMPTTDLVAPSATPPPEPVHITKKVMRAEFEKPNDDEVAGMIDSFTLRRSQAISLQDRQNLYREGMSQADDWLLREAFDACQNLLDEIRLVAETLEESKIAEVTSFQENIEQTRRIAEKVHSMDLDSLKQLSDLEIGVAGRYYCLMLRRWDRGLTWLSKTSDPTLASLAKQEIELLQSDHDFGSRAWIALANRWESAAKRADGRAKDSIIFHTVTLKRKATDSLQGVAQLEHIREVERIEAQLPAYLLMALNRDRESDSMETDSSGENVHLPADGLTSEQPSTMEPFAFGMLGRVTSDGQKTPIQLVYSPGAVLGVEALEKIEKVWTVKERKLQIECSGSFVLFEPTTVRFLLSLNPATQRGRVFLDGNQIEFAESQTAVEETLEAGSYRVIWRLRLTPETSESLSIVNAASNAPIEVRHTKPL